MVGLPGRKLDRKAVKAMLSIRPGASSGLSPRVKDLRRAMGFKKTSNRDGIRAGRGLVSRSSQDLIF
jgi:hypothetical protein